MLYRQKEKDIFKKIKDSCIEDLTIWNTVNIGFPLLTVIISVFTFFYSAKFNNASSFYPVIFSGVLPLISVNLLVAASFFLIKFNREKERELGLNTTNTRLKLIIYSSFSYLISSSIFVVQTIYSPFTTNTQRLVQIIITSLAIWFSMNIANKLFLLQEDMIQKSYEENISEGVSKLKNAIL